MNRRYQCPACQSMNVVDIVYGFPSDELIEASRRGEVHLGGCIMERNNPIKHCRDCGKEFGGIKKGGRRAK